MRVHHMHAALSNNVQLMYMYSRASASVCSTDLLNMKRDSALRHAVRHFPSSYALWIPDWQRVLCSKIGPASLHLPTFTPGLFGHEGSPADACYWPTRQLKLSCLHLTPSLHHHSNTHPLILLSHLPGAAVSVYTYAAPRL